MSNKSQRSGENRQSAGQKSNVGPYQPGCQGHVLMDNHHPLIVDCRVTKCLATDAQDDAKKEADHDGASQRNLSSSKD